MKRGVVIVACLLCFAIFGASQAPKDKRVPKENGILNTAPNSKTEAEQRDAANPPSQTIAIYNQPSPTQHNGDNMPSQDAMDVERQLAKFTGYLVIVGLLQVLILAVQAVLFFQQRNIMGQHRVSLEQLATAAEDNAKAIQTQALIMDGQLKAMEGQLAAIEGQKRSLEESVAVSRDAAKAASLNAQAVINTERPWLVVATFFDKDKPELCRFGCRNQGNTPAKIISISAQPFFVTNPSALPVPPDYSSPVAMPDLTLFVHTDSFPIGDGLSARQFIESRGRWEQVLHANEFLVYFGNVVYRDTLYPESSPEGLHETRWCFIYQPGGERMFLRGGPKEYNGYA
jgi:hypothetical protein